MALYVSAVIINIIEQNLMYRSNQISFRALFIVPAPPEFLLCLATDNETKRDSATAGSEKILK